MKRRSNQWLAIGLTALLITACAGATPTQAPTGTPAATTAAATAAATSAAAPTPAATATAAATPTAAASASPSEAPSASPSEAPSASAEPSPSASPAAILPTAPTGYAELDQALNGDFTGKKVSLQSQWVGGENVNFTAAIAAFEAKTGIDIATDAIGSNHEVVLRTLIEGGAPPDLAQIAQPAALAGYAEDGKLIDLSFMVNDRFKKDFEAVLDLVTVDDKVYGVPYKVDVKSTVWYPRAAFEAAGYTVPKTWDELKALSSRIVSEGKGNPWCISIEHGAATGWVGTDWIEDILLRTAPRDTYQKWIDHEIPFTDPAIKNAFDKAAEIFFAPDYAYGGPTYMTSTWVGQTMDPAFENPPKCWFHKQALWYSDFFPPRDTPGADVPKPGEDVGVFYFPPIDPQYGNPALGSGDMIMMFADRPEVRAVAEFLATPEAIAAWIQAAGVTSANSSTPSEWYEGNYKAGIAADIIGNATTFGFDASDLMPKEVGQGTFWNGMVEWISASGANTDEVLKTIEESWPAAD